MREYKARSANGCQRARTAARFSSPPLYAPPPGSKGHTRSVPPQQTLFSSLFPPPPHRTLRRAWRCHKSSGAFNTKCFAIAND